LTLSAGFTVDVAGSTVDEEPLLPSDAFFSHETRINEMQMAAVAMQGFIGYLHTKDSEQADQSLPGGTSLYSQINLQANIVGWFSGFGLIYQSDKIGESQKFKGIAAKYELTWRGFYVEIAYGTAEQDFQNRAVSKRAGTLLMNGGGIRVPFVSDVLFF
jgi:hypothetical protein